ncbi:hypothetical protein CRYPD_50 [uncultured Candidatus Thioglobus sp.]|nr:hypothetical protein CRYPD_50 [uncultured Candidatus Thioglobus sp.]
MIHTHTPGFADNTMIHNHWLSIAHHHSHTHTRLCKQHNDTQPLAQHSTP